MKVAIFSSQSIKKIKIIMNLIANLPCGSPNGKTKEKNTYKEYVELERGLGVDLTSNLYAEPSAAFLQAEVFSPRGRR
ncbi:MULTISPECIES: hypothetical protein [Cytobacillus]|uniref:hypothetical protein n=1 Tax=Cytobacillus TaxID=2675230 RepID=UPI00203FFBDD|nr:hypothetical protein [Cytobacillus firmus]